MRNLRIVKSALAELHIPLHTVAHTPRRTLPNFVVALLDRLKAKHLYANIEYEVDELRRDVKICELTKAQGIKPTYVHDKCIIEPNVIKTKQDKVYTVNSHLAFAAKIYLYLNIVGILPVPEELDHPLECQNLTIHRPLSTTSGQPRKHSPLCRVSGPFRHAGARCRRGIQT